MRSIRFILALSTGLLLTACEREPTASTEIRPLAAFHSPRGPGADVVAVDLGTLSAYPDADYGAVAINDPGQVIGVITTHSGEIRSFSWWHGVMTDLGLPGDETEVTAINNAGQVIGTYRPSPAPCGPGCHGFRAFIWDRGVTTDLGTLEGVDILAGAINEAGQVIGIWVKADRSFHGFIWDRGTMKDLGDLGGDWTVPAAINNAGQIVGTSKNAAGEDRAFIWTNGVMTDLGETSMGANGINNRGQVIGEGWDFQGFLWTNGVMTDLGTLGGSGSVVGAINDRGQVVGTSRTADGEDHAFLWFHGTMTDLGVTDLGSLSDEMTALLINDVGDVVGEMRVQQEEHPFVWSHGVITDLTPDSPFSGTPRSINNSGQVVGESHLTSGVHAMLWQIGPSGKARH